MGVEIKLGSVKLILVLMVCVVVSTRAQGTDPIFSDELREAILSGKVKDVIPDPSRPENYGAKFSKGRCVLDNYWLSAGLDRKIEFIRNMAFLNAKNLLESGVLDPILQKKLKEIVDSDITTLTVSMGLAGSTEGVIKALREIRSRYLEELKLLKDKRVQEALDLPSHEIQLILNFIDSASKKVTDLCKDKDYKKFTEIYNRADNAQSTGELLIELKAIREYVACGFTSIGTKSISKDFKRWRLKSGANKCVEYWSDQLECVWASKLSEEPVDWSRISSKPDGYDGYCHIKLSPGHSPSETLDNGGQNVEEV